MKIMQEAYRKLVEKAEKIERIFGSLQDFAAFSTISKDEHNMRMRQKSLSEIYSQIDVQDFDFLLDRTLQKELHELELADLCDLKNGRFDGEYF